MFNKVKILAVLILTVLTSIGSFILSPLAVAEISPSISSLDLIPSACASGSGRNQELARLQHEIAAADTINHARSLALAPTDDAIDALKNARTIMPFSDDLQSAEARLSDARARILLASSQEQVADEFSGMMLAGLDDDSIAKVDVGKADCNYSTGETIAIVIGLILGIIPGLILLVVLC